MGRNPLTESFSLVHRKGLVAKAFPKEEQESKPIHFVSLLSAVEVAFKGKKLLSVLRFLSVQVGIIYCLDKKAVNTCFGS